MYGHVCVFLLVAFKSTITAGNTCNTTCYQSTGNPLKPNASKIVLEHCSPRKCTGCAAWSVLNVEGHPDIYYGCRKHCEMGSNLGDNCKAIDAKEAVCCCTKDGCNNPWPTGAAGEMPYNFTHFVSYTQNCFHIRQNVSIDPEIATHVFCPSPRYYSEDHRPILQRCSYIDGPTPKSPAPQQSACFARVTLDDHNPTRGRWELGCQMDCPAEYHCELEDAKTAKCCCRGQSCNNMHLGREALSRIACTPACYMGSIGYYTHLTADELQVNDSSISHGACFSNNSVCVVRGVWLSEDLLQYEHSCEPVSKCPSDQPYDCGKTMLKGKHGGICCCRYPGCNAPVDQKLKWPKVDSVLHEKLSNIMLEGLQQGIDEGLYPEIFTPKPKAEEAGVEAGSGSECGRAAGAVLVLVVIGTRYL